MMEITVVTPPEPLITLDEAKAYLHVDFSDDDALITGLIAAASAHIDGPMGWLGRAIGEQELEAVFPEFCGSSVALPLPPVISVQSLKYLDTGNVEQTVDPANYSYSTDRLWLSDGYTFPGVYKAWNAVRVAFTAGYEEVPEPLKVAVKMHIGTLYENRASIGEGKVILPHAYEALCAPFKVWSL